MSASTANDAYMCDCYLIFLRDCVAALTDEEHRWALDQMEGVLKAGTSPSMLLDFERLKLRYMVIPNRAGTGGFE